MFPANKKKINQSKIYKLSFENTINITINISV